MLSKQFSWIPLVAVGAMAACDLGPSLDSADVDAAVIAADAAIEDLEMMHGPGLGSAGGIFPELLGGRPDCPKTEDVFLCDPIEREGLTYTRSITYYTAAGVAQEAYDEATTATIVYDILVAGERQREGWSASMIRGRSLIVTGLLDGAPTVSWSGTTTGSRTQSRHFDGQGERTYTMESDGEIIDVVIPYPREDDSWPLSGTVIRTITMVRGDGEERQRTVQVEFNGTSQVPVTVNGETMTVDLTQRFGGRHMRGGGRFGDPASGGGGSFGGQ